MKLKMMTYNRYLDTETGWQFEYDLKDVGPGTTILRCYSREDLLSEICEGVFLDSWRQLKGKGEIDHSVRILSCPKSELESVYKTLLDQQTKLHSHRPPRSVGLDAEAFPRILPIMLSGWRELLLSIDDDNLRKRGTDLRVVASKRSPQ